MIQRIRTSKTFRGLCLTLALTIFFELVAPTQAWALTGGPAQPEFGSFTPIGTSDMVDLSSGDMSYNIPLMDVGGYPLNIAYSSGVGMDEEASWVGLGWNLAIGQINRNVRGIPDDFKGGEEGDKLIYENYMKPNVTVGGSVNVTPAVFGIEIGDFIEGGVSVGLAATYNNYSGLTMSPSVGANIEIGNNVSVGFNVQSTDEGMCISPSVSLHGKKGAKDSFNNSLSGTVGASFNSRQGLTGMSLNMTRKSTYYKDKTDPAIKRRLDSQASASVGSSISFTDALFTPTKRVGMNTGSFTFNGAVGGEVWGVEGQLQINAYGTVTSVREEEKKKEVDAYGYQYTDEADDYSVLDFNREKDAAFSVNMTNLALTNYTYDIYSVKGQGVSGMYRPYRNQVGYVYDTRVDDISNSSTLGIEVGAGNAVHVGVDIENVTVVSHSGVWKNENNIIDDLKTDFSPNHKGFERVHYKNVGDLSSDRDYDIFTDKIGAYQPVRIPFAGVPFYRRMQSKFEQKSAITGGVSPITVGSAIKRTERQLRNQAIFNVTYEDVQRGIGYGPLVQNSSIVVGKAKPHHTVEVQILRNDGARYVYGLPAYNTKKVEATFAVDGSTGDCNTGLVGYNEAYINTPKNLPNDQYLNRITTPAYVHSHLLTSVLSTDYQDIDDNGPSPKDFGSYTKFTYQQFAGSVNYKWRVPYTANTATYNEGLKTDVTDDQGNYVYGEKELHYVETIETKTHIAKFHLSERKDAFGVDGIEGSDPNIETSSKMYKLDSICLYSTAEYYNTNGIFGGAIPVPIKTAHFVYNYDLCPAVPNNFMGGAVSYPTLTETSNGGGKLTLEKVYFTYRNSRMGKYTPYTFDYGQDISGNNPDYNVKGYDSWGNYMPNDGDCGNGGEPSAAEFPYTNQNIAEQDVRAAVWTLRKIKTPSGGEITVEYESDRYGFVQDKKVQRMFKAIGAGDGDTTAAKDLIPEGFRELYEVDGLGKNHFEYLYVKVENDGSNFSDYIPDTESPIQFRFLLNMTKLGGGSTNNTAAKFDYVSGYFFVNTSLESQFFHHSGERYLSIPVKRVKIRDSASEEKINPISMAGWRFGQKYLSKHVFSLDPNGDETPGGSVEIEEIIQDLFGPQIISNLREIFTGPNKALEDKLICRKFSNRKSWVRLQEPDGEKLGGGCRVKTVRMNDKWAESMIEGTPALYRDMAYGQAYDYRLANTKTSGVATYEPVGNKENPHVQPVFTEKKKLLAPDEHNFIEGPFGESFYPSPQVTYSRVTVSNLQGGDAPSGKTLKQLHKTGKVVTEFYTTKDYPTVVDQTEFQAKKDDNSSFASLLKLSAKKHVYGSQGYTIHLNDMNGKQKAQWVYAEGQTQPISGVEYKYDNSPVASSSPSTTANANKGKLDNEVTVIDPDGIISKKVIGVEYDIVNDFRENKTKTTVFSVNTNLASFFVGVIPGLVPIPLPDMAINTDQMRTVSTTKVINTFGLLKETIAHDAGAKVSTRNLAWDERTGEVLLTETVDEYNDKYYTLNYPAHWVYDGMGQASQNLGYFGTLSGSSGSYVLSGISGYVASDFIIPGDELYFFGTDDLGWVTEVDDGTDAIEVIDENGDPLGGQSGYFSVIRSGHRNLQSAGIMNVTLMHNPLYELDGVTLATNIQDEFLTSTDWTDWHIINAGAVDYSDDWMVGCECGVNNASGTYNPYRVNEKGVWRTKSSRTYLTGRNYQTEITPRQQGFFNKFSPMYRRDSDSSHWDKDYNGWTYVAEVTQYSPYGFELENKDALDRHSAAQYGYNNTFPIAVGANTKYKEIGFDGFEDRMFDGCEYSSHFQFGAVANRSHAHTGRYSIQVNRSSRVTMEKKLDCEVPE